MGAAVRPTVCGQLIAGSIFARRARRIEPAILLPTASRSAIAGARLALADDPSGDGDRSPSGGNTFKRGASNEDLTRPRNAERVQRALLGIFALLRRAQQNTSNVELNITGTKPARSYRLWPWSSMRTANRTVRYASERTNSLRAQRSPASARSPLIP